MKPGLYVATVRGVEGVHVLFDESGLGQTASLVEGCYSHGDDNITDARPLVVLDPESEDDCRRLMEAALAHRSAATPTLETIRDILSALVDPKPAEPTGLGALVRDRNGNKWLRMPLDRNPWCCWEIAAHHDRADCEWAAIDVAEVLSEGWSE